MKINKTNSVNLLGIHVEIEFSDDGIQIKLDGVKQEVDKNEYEKASRALFKVQKEHAILFRTGPNCNIAIAKALLKFAAVAMTTEAKNLADAAHLGGRQISLLIKKEMERDSSQSEACLLREAMKIVRRDHPNWFTHDQIKDKKIHRSKAISMCIDTALCQDLERQAKLWNEAREVHSRADQIVNALMDEMRRLRKNNKVSKEKSPEVRKILRANSTTGWMDRARRAREAQREWRIQMQERVRNAMNNLEDGIDGIAGRLGMIRVR